MNERIRQLAKQAYEDVIKNTPSFLVTKELYEQKFAELIVRECSQISKDHQRNYYESHGARIAKKIKEHFGVEE